MDLSVLILVKNPNLMQIQQALFHTAGFLSIIVNILSINELVFGLALREWVQRSLIQKFGNEFKFSDLLFAGRTVSGSYFGDFRVWVLSKRPPILRCFHLEHQRNTQSFNN
jgi:hypothetical protein